METAMPSIVSIVETTTASSIIVVVLTGLFLHVSTSTRRRNARKAQLRAWALEAVQKRDEKEHACLRLHNNDREDEEDRFFSAAETQRLVANGKLDAAENFCKLARRCRRYGRNNSSDTGVNAITEEFYKEEYKVAKAITNTEKSSSSPPILCGVPISVKDCIALKGSLETAGLACRTSDAHRSAKDSALVSVLRSTAGALPFVRGNVPQLLMLPETYNFVWGVTRNPWDLKRVPGGSSGGDAALVAMKCVPLAVGTDVAGSIRIPAAYCGVVGFKPTSTRISSKGSMRPRKDNKLGSAVVIPAVPGPIARTVEDCALFMEAVCVPELFDLDSKLPPLPFQKRIYEEDKKRLKIGYFVSDGWFEPCAAAKRALMETVDNLQKAGHDCVPFELPTAGWDTYTLLIRLSAADGNFRGYVEGLEGEDMIEQYKTLYAASRIPNWLRPILRMIIDKRRSTLLGCTRSGGLTVHDYWQRCADLLEMRERWDDAVQAQKLDGIIHAALPTPAMLHGMSGEFTAPFSYTFIANMLLWPAGTVPVSTVKQDEQHYRMEDIPADQRDLFARKAAQVMEGSEGLPLSVAIMTPAFRDELCLRIMKEVESLARFDKEPEAYKHVVALLPYK